MKTVVVSCWVVAAVALGTTAVKAQERRLRSTQRRYLSDSTAWEDPSIVARELGRLLQLDDDASSLSMKVTDSPTSAPTSTPTSSPTVMEQVVTPSPTTSPSASPSVVVASEPPSSVPSLGVTSQVPSLVASEEPSSVPSSLPTILTLSSTPTMAPTGADSEPPSAIPTVPPVDATTAAPVDPATPAPVDATTAAPVDATTDAPSVSPTVVASAPPTNFASATPTGTTTAAPVVTPTEAPVVAPTDAPVVPPTDAPVVTPTEAPVETPVAAPTEAPVETPVATPTEAPVETPVASPTEAPVETPVATPTVAPVDVPSDLTVGGIVQARASLSTLQSVVIAAGILPVLSNPNATLTLFAPTNDALAKLDADVVTRLLQPEYLLHLTDVLAYHAVVGQEITSDFLSTGAVVPTVQRIGETLLVNVVDGNNIQLITTSAGFANSNVERATVVVPDLDATNGVVHEIDTVLLPLFMFQTLFDVLQQFSQYSTLVSALVASGYDATLAAATDKTFLAPTNDAFDALPDGQLDALLNEAGFATLLEILAFHTLDSVYNFQSGAVGDTLETGVIGESVTVTAVGPQGISFNGVTSSAFFLAAENIIYEMTEVLSVGGATAPVPTPAPTPVPGTQTLGALVAADTDLTTLLSFAAMFPQLVAILNADTQRLTLFAPINAAWEDMGAEMLALYMTPEFRLHATDILGYHLLPQKLFEDSIASGLEVGTGQGEGETIEFAVGDSIELLTTAVRNPNITDAEAPEVISAQNVGSNGVLYKIDELAAPSWFFLDLVDSVSRYPSRFSFLIEFVTRSGAATTIASLEQHTLLAPNDEAWAAFGSTIDELLVDVTGTIQLLSRHVLPQVFNFELAAATQELPTILPTVSVTATVTDQLAFDGVVAQAFYLYDTGIVYELGAVLGN